MIQIRPFRAWRYNLDTLGKLAPLVSPPYDKVPDSLQRELLTRHPQNVVRLIKPVLPWEPNPASDPYAGAAALWQEWRETGVLVQDERPTMTLYVQRGPLPTGGSFERWALQCCFRLADYGVDTIRRHEQTLSKPLTDRLYLMRATKANTGHIFALYNDPGLQGYELLKPWSEKAPLATTLDEDGVSHSVIVIDDPALHQAIAALLAEQYLIIADGHHRYETALQYKKERLAAGGSPEAGFNWVMLSLVGMEHPGLEILATHRALRRTRLDEAALLPKLAELFTVRDLTDFAALRAELAAAPQATPGALGWYAPSGKARLLHLKPGAWERHPEAARWDSVERDLDVVILHRLILEHLIGFTEEEVRVEQVLDYLRDPAEGQRGVDSGAYQGLFLLRPTTMEQVQSMTEQNHVMPQKSTDFFPKIWSGFTMRDLEDAW